ncbi:8144_t:CDS:2 [Entrophospora sp. SA101]|nr:8144_t:CDS:2 [Entrophospora sp. SA101]
MNNKIKEKNIINIDLEPLDAQLALQAGIPPNSQEKRLFKILSSLMLPVGVAEVIAMIKKIKATITILV